MPGAHDYSLRDSSRRLFLASLAFSGDEKLRSAPNKCKPRLKFSCASTAGHKVRYLGETALRCDGQLLAISNALTDHHHTSTDGYQLYKQKIVKSKDEKGVCPTFNSSARARCPLIFECPVVWSDTL